MSRLTGLQEPYVSCPSAISQKAAEAALKGPQNCLRIMTDSYRKRRDMVVEILKDNDLFVYSPQGTIYMLIDISSSGMDSYSFARSASLASISSGDISPEFIIPLRRASPIFPTPIKPILSVFNSSLLKFPS